MRAQAGDHVGVVLLALAALRDKDRGAAVPSRAPWPDPAASATFEITTAISAPFSRPARIDSAMARKLEPRPESRMPRRDDLAFGPSRLRSRVLHPALAL